MVEFDFDSVVGLGDLMEVELKGEDKSIEDIYDFVIEMCDFIIAYEGEIPGAAPEQCGNYSEQNMNMAKYYIKKYKKELTENKRFIYPN